MYLYVLHCLRGSVGVVRVHRCKYSLAMDFSFCDLKFCNRACTRSTRKTPGEVQQDSIAGAWRKIRTPKPEQLYILNLCNMSAILNRSAKGSAHDRADPASATSRNQYKSFSIFQPKFHENFAKFIKNAVLVFEPVKWYRGGFKFSPIWFFSWISFKSRSF